MKIVFTKDHSDEAGFHAAGELIDVSTEQAQVLIKAGVAQLRPPTGPTEYKRKPAVAAEMPEDAENSADDEEKQA